MPIKLTLERTLVSYKNTKGASYDWVFKKESYKPWETFEIPTICGVAGVYQAFIPDNANIEEWKEKLKDKAFQEMQNSIENIMQQIEALGSVK